MGASNRFSTDCPHYTNETCGLHLEPPVDWGVTFPSPSRCRGEKRSVYNNIAEEVTPSSIEKEKGTAGDEAWWHFPKPSKFHKGKALTNFVDALRFRAIIIDAEKPRA